VASIIGDAALLRGFSCLEPFRRVLLAVSGGPDSMALMHLARRWLALKGREPASLVVVTVDHGLRPESKGEATFVAEQARALRFSHATIVWTGEKPKTGIQAAARRARYDLLASYAFSSGAACIATAHTEDDQAETLLMRLRRGSGVDGLSAMAHTSERSGVTIVRPLLGFSKGRLTAYLRASCLPFIRDPSNNNAAFERVRLRHATKALASAGITRSSLAMTAARLGRSREALARINEDFLDRHFQVTPLAQGKISREAFEALPDDIALRALGRILSLIGGAAESPRLMRLEHLLKNLKLRKKETTLGGCIIIAACGTLNFYRELGRLGVRPAPFEPGAKRVWDGRFILAFAPIDYSSMTMRQLGADGWISYKKTMKERSLPITATRLAALTTPALWKGNRLICAPLLNFAEPTENAAAGPPVEAVLVPSLARFLSGALDETASVLGKDTPIPYL
jgi:tRNA(Ile)-lysidine synthase